MAAHRVLPSIPDLAQDVDDVLLLAPWLLLIALTVIAAITT